MKPGRHVPAVVDKHLGVIDFNKDGGLLLASSDLTGRCWTGSIWYFQDSMLAPDMEKCTDGSQTESGISDGCWIDSERIALASDSGALELWQIKTNTSVLGSGQASSLLACVGYEYSHDDILNSVTMRANQTGAITASADSTCKLWDLSELTPVVTYRAHEACVYNVSAHPVSEHLFLSCSQDGNVILWDLRKEKPASLLCTDYALSCCPSYVTWQPLNAEKIVIGAEDGSLIAHDIRGGGCDVTMPEPPKQQKKHHSRRINRIRFSPNNPSMFAAVSDDCTASVNLLDTPGMEIRNIYVSTEHTDVAHGIAWKPHSDVVYTCGWDFRVLHHHPTNSDASDAIHNSDITPSSKSRTGGGGDQGVEGISED